MITYPDSRTEAFVANGCDHIGGPELIEMAERHLAESNVPVSTWNGQRFGWGEDVDSPWWKSVYIEIERRGKEWVVTRIDRSNDPIDPSKRGFVAISDPD